MTFRIDIDGSTVSLATLRQVRAQPVVVHLRDDVLAGIDESRRCVEQTLARHDAVYGINTGFGRLARVRIPDDQLEALQRNLLLSHSAGVGDLLADEIVRLVLVLKVAALARGCSGVRRELVEALCRLLEHGVYPCIPERGSVGASGDLAPLAHLGGVLIGAGEARHGDARLAAAQALALAGLAPITLAPKEGLALINGTQVSTALALDALLDTEHVFAAACVAGALSVDAAQGSDTPFDARISRLRGHRGQADVAEALRGLMAGSGIRASHIDCNRVQDPYSLRCQPQVMGACLDAMRHVAGVLEVEANAVTDNPLVFAGDDAILSGGNFHAEPVAMVCDHLALAIAEIGALCERRIALLIDPGLSGLPPFLVEESGLNSGFMVAQVTAAALASENKLLAHPASVDSLPTSANQEDHVSMATTAALRLRRMIDNTTRIVAVELLAAAQGVEFHRPSRSSPVLEGAIAALRERVPRYERDRPLGPDIDAVADGVRGGEWVDHVAALLPSNAPR